jgi:hypothetical protein
MSRPLPSRFPLLPRRAVLMGSLAALAGIPQAAGEPLASNVVPLSDARLEVRRLAAVLHAAIQDEIEAETAAAHDRGKKPAYRAARKRADALQKEFDALAEEVWDQPVRSWADVVTRAEIAQAYGQDDLSPCMGDQALTALLEAVLAMGGRHV